MPTSIGEELGVERSTVTNFINCVNKQASDWIKFPTTPNAITFMAK